MGARRFKKVHIFEPFWALVGESAFYPTGLVDDWRLGNSWGTFAWCGAWSHRRAVVYACWPAPMKTGCRQRFTQWRCVPTEARCARCAFLLAQNEKSGRCPWMIASSEWNPDWALAAAEGLGRMGEILAS